MPAPTRRQAIVTPRRVRPRPKRRVTDYRVALDVREHILIAPEPDHVRTPHAMPSAP